MGFSKYNEIEFIYEYDFAVDGGATGTIALRPLGNAMLADVVIKDLSVIVETALNDAGDTATVTLGPGGGDVDGYLVDFMTLAESIDTQIRVGEIAGALLWDDTNDHRINYRLSTDVLAVPTLTVATEALTAGKAKFIFTCIRY